MLCSIRLTFLAIGCALGHAVRADVSLRPSTDGFGAAGERERRRQERQRRAMALGSTRLHDQDLDQGNRGFWVRCVDQF